MPPVSFEEEPHWLSSAQPKRPVAMVTAPKRGIPNFKCLMFSYVFVVILALKLSDMASQFRYIFKAYICKVISYQNS